MLKGTSRDDSISPLDEDEGNSAEQDDNNAHLMNAELDSSSAAANSSGLNQSQEQKGDPVKKVKLSTAERLVASFGCEQVTSLPLYTQILAKIESCGREGIALRNLGIMFGLDFYKSRRLGNKLQTYPDIVTVLKEVYYFFFKETPKI